MHKETEMSNIWQLNSCMSQIAGFFSFYYLNPNAIRNTIYEKMFWILNYGFSFLALNFYLYTENWKIAFKTNEYLLMTNLKKAFYL